MQTSKKDDLGSPILFLFFYSLLLGAELGGLSKNLESYGSIILVAPLLSFENLIWLYLFCLFVYSSFKENSRILKFAYFLGGLSFLFNESVINKIGHKSLYAVKIALLFAATILLLNYLTKTVKQYQSILLEKNEDKSPDKPATQDAQKTARL